MEKYELTVDPISVGLTKPSTHLGVPLVAFYFNVMSSFVGWMIFQNIFDQKIVVTLFFICLFLIIHFLMAWMTFKDPFGLSIFWLNVTRFRQHVTYRFWNQTDSYSP